eukprot:52714-Eustigmatos_ZCMA.PRE.1
MLEADTMEDAEDVDDDDRALPLVFNRPNIFVAISNALALTNFSVSSSVDDEEDEEEDVGCLLE